VPGGAVLISGIGIAGPTLAYWLRRAGFAPSLVEHAPGLRHGGYVIDFWGRGYDIAERMGLAGDLDRGGYHVRELRIVDDRGRRLAGFGTRVFRELTGGRFVTLARSDLSRLLFEKIKDTTEILFGDEIVDLRQDADGVSVRFRRAGERRYDLVIGADGLNSPVRGLVFGPMRHFEKRLGYLAVACEIPGYRPRDEASYVVYGEPGLMVGRFAMRDDRTLVLFVFADRPDGAPPGLAEPQAILRERLGKAGWECRQFLAALDRVADLYFDRVSQIRMGAWSKGRMALVGDAAFCVSLTAGQGAALAMTAAYVLAGELGRPGAGYAEAFRRYEALLRPFIARKQRGAERFAAAFAPRSRRGLALRNQAVRLLAIPGLARIAFGRDIADGFALPDYGWAP
jgi:2-polyprenyl-6-methoxyphenol hydroxylase-like FAD-dependent oxidoreductase